MLRTRKDILLMVLAILASAMVMAAKTTYEGITNINANLPSWLITSVIVLYFIVLVALIVSIFVVVRLLNRINEQQEDATKEDKAKLNAIVKKLGITPEEITEEKDKETIRVVKG